MLVTASHSSSRTTRKLPKRYAPVLFALIMSVTLSGLLSATIVAINTGLGAGFLGRWLHAYGMAWVIAFPLVTLIAPKVRRLVDLLTD